MFRILQHPFRSGTEAFRRCAVLAALVSLVLCQSARGQVVSKGEAVATTFSGTCDGSTGDIAGQPDALRVEARGHLDRRALGVCEHRLDGEVFGEHFAAARMDDPRGRADLGVRKCRHVLLEKINQPALALEHGKDGQAGGMNTFGRQLDGLWSGLRLWRAQQVGGLAAKVRIGEGTVEARQRRAQACQERCF